ERANARASDVRTPTRLHVQREREALPVDRQLSTVNARALHALGLGAWGSGLGLESGNAAFSFLPSIDGFPAEDSRGESEALLAKAFHPHAARAHHRPPFTVHQDSGDCQSPP